MEAHILILIFLVLLLIRQSCRLWREKKYSAMIECAWDSRIRVIEIESQLISTDPQGNARSFVSILSSICLDKESLIRLHGLAESEHRATYTETDLKTEIIEMFGNAAAELVYEAVIKTSMAAVLLAGKRHGEYIDNKKVAEPELDAAYVFRFKDNPECLNILSNPEIRFATA